MNYATCHPDKPILGFGLCCACYQRKRYHDRRKLGMPAWQAAHRTLKGWIGLGEADKRWHETHRATARAKRKRKYERDKKLYGGDPSRISHARNRWLMLKNHKFEKGRSMEVCTCRKARQPKKRRKR